jgi:DNA gyrase subunit A
MSKAPVESPYNDTEEMDIPSSLKFLVHGYADYAKEVVTDRAIINIDGFKPSQRRILYTMKALEKVKEMTKSLTIAGAVAKLHPHGDGSVYETMVRMVDSSEHMNIPFLHGKGSFGKVTSTGQPAASRYTNAMLSDMAEELFGEMHGVSMIPSYDGKYQEPELLPTTFPNLLCNPSSGIAVGVATNIPAFHFNEVLSATVELIETGDITGVLVPDYTTKGFYINDEKELRKIMDTGRGKIKLRGKWYVDGKTIIIEEIPYYTTIQAIEKKCKLIQGISDFRDETDRKHGLQIAIECTNKNMVDTVLTEVLRLTDLQMSMTTNLVVIIDNKPRVIGIKELLNEWVKFRTNIVEKTLKIDYENVINAIPRYELLVDLITNVEKRDGFVDALTKNGTAKAKNYLRILYPTADESIFSWILDMKLSSLSGVASKENKLESLRKHKIELEADMKDVKRVIVRQLKDLNKRYKFPRSTVVTTEDYVFEKQDELVVKAAPIPVIVQIDGKFVKKVRLTRGTENVQGINCMSDDVISFVDTQGRLLRVNLENIDFVSANDRGIYLPVYLEVEDDFEVVCYEMIQDKKVGYVFSDGFASIVDYSEWVDSKRTTRITANGVSPLAGLIVGELDFSKNYLLMITNSGKFGFAPTDFKHKHRTARTKLVSVKEGDEIVQVTSLSYTDILGLVSSPEKYMGKLSTLAHGDKFNTDYLNTLV